MFDLSNHLSSSFFLPLGCAVLVQNQTTGPLIKVYLHCRILTAASRLPLALITDSPTPTALLQAQSFIRNKSLRMALSYFTVKTEGAGCEFSQLSTQT